jgi:hypothetical protein
LDNQTKIRHTIRECSPMLSRCGYPVLVRGTTFLENYDTGTSVNTFLI